jgi:hypothetical protein
MNLLDPRSIDAFAEQSLQSRQPPLQPGVAVRVNDMPRCIDQLCDRVRTQAVEGRRNPRSGNCEPSVDEKLAISAGEDGNISANLSKL